MEKYQPTPRSVEQCKDLLITIGKMLCVKAELISTRLLSKEDKQDMLNGHLSDEALFFHIKHWIDGGMINYNSEELTPYLKDKNKPIFRYWRDGKIE